ncbi:MAG TPA: kelch repeat-containing protein [bacterium]
MIRNLWRVRLVATGICLVPCILFAFGCGGSTKTVKSEPTPAARPNNSPLAANGYIGNTLSTWIDRTQTFGDSFMPAAAEDCGLIYDPLQNRIVLFGGKRDDDQNVNEVWVLNLAENTWQQIAVAGASPPASEDHTAIYDPVSHRMILYGGENGPAWNNLWSFDLKDNFWRDMTDSTGPAREDHTAIFDSRRQRMVIFGGRDNYFDNLNDIWELNLDPASATFEKWQKATVEEPYPPGRADHVAVYDSLKNRMVVYGGWNRDQKEYLDDTWAFYFPQTADTIGFWKHIKTKKSRPPRRRHSVGAYDSARNWFIICGGFGEEGYLNDVWAFDLNTDVWINITPGPQPRIDHQAVYDPINHRLILYGGDARLSAKFHDLWELQIQPDMSFDQIKKEAGAIVKKSP